MSAFLYLPSSPDARLPRRVDLASFGSLFREAEEPKPASTTSNRRRIAAAYLVLLFALGDTILMARPDALAACFVRCQKTISAI